MCIARTEVQCDTTPVMVMGMAWWCVWMFLGLRTVATIWIYIPTGMRMFGCPLGDLARINAV
jgi:hypothetical protein